MRVRDEWRYPIVRGDTVFVIDAYGHELERRALTGVVDGRDFRVVWVCRAECWPDNGIPWPVEHVSATRRSCKASVSVSVAERAPRGGTDA